MAMLPNGASVLGQLGPAAARVSTAEAERCVRRATALALAHTRGRGFSNRGDEVDSDLAAVIVASAARALLNPAFPLRMSEQTLTAVPGGFGDWSEAEAEVLRRHRG